MTRVRLYWIDNDHQHVTDSNRVSIPLTFLRLRAMFLIGSQRRAWDGLFDTGTALTVFPDSIWRQFAQDIEWLTFPPGRPTKPWWTSASGLTGGGYACRLGAIPIILFDAEQNLLPPVSVVCKFVEDQGRLPRQIVLGLAHGILQGRHLHLDPDRCEAWLEDRA